MLTCASYGGTSGHTSLYEPQAVQSDFQLFPFQNQLRLCILHTHAHVLWTVGRARVYNAFSILRVYVWVRTVARLLGLSSTLLLVLWNSENAYYY
jgi:hypothetical protein